MRQKYSCYLKIITLKGRMADIKKAANEFAMLASVTAGSFKTLDQSPAEQAQMQIAQTEKETWAAFLTERRLIEAKCSEPPCNTLQFELVRTKTDSLDDLMPIVNAISDTHEVVKIDVAAKKEPRGRVWVAQISYGAHLG